MGGRKGEDVGGERRFNPIELLFQSPIAIMTINTTQWDSAEYLKTEEDMLLYLEACLEEAGEDLAFIAHALGVINRSRWGNSNGLTPQ